MRQLTAASPRAARGLTLIELMVTIAIAAILLVQGLPAYADYVANSRLREGANLIVTGALLARSEAIKRNHAVTIDVVGQRLVVTQVDTTGSGTGAVTTTTQLRSMELPPRLQTSALGVTFDSTGRPFPFGTDVTVTVSAADRPGSGLRCPSIHLEAGGTVNLIRDGACS